MNTAAHVKINDPELDRILDACLEFDDASLRRKTKAEIKYDRLVEAYGVHVAEGIIDARWRLEKRAEARRRRAELAQLFAVVPEYITTAFGDVSVNQDLYAGCEEAAAYSWS